MVLATMLGFVSAVDMPVRQSFAAELVPRRDLVNAIALNSASFNLARVIGPAVAGLTLAVFGPAFNFGINAVSYLAVLFGAVADGPARAAPHRAAGALRHRSVTAWLRGSATQCARPPSSGRWCCWAGWPPSP